MAERQSAQTEQANAALQTDLSSIVRPTPFTAEGVKLVASKYEKTPTEIKTALPAKKVSGDTTNTPDLLHDNLRFILTQEERTNLGIASADSVGKTLTPETQIKIVKLLLEQIQQHPDRAATIKEQLKVVLPSGEESESCIPDTQGLPEIIAALQVVGVEAATQQYRATNKKTKEFRVSSSKNKPGSGTGFDKTFGDESSRRKVYSEIGGFGDEIILEGEEMSVHAEKSHKTEKTAEMDLRLAQALFNAAVPPEQLIELTKLGLQKDQETDPNRKDELAHEIVLKRQRLYKAILKAYEVQTEKGGKVKTKDGEETDEVNKIAKEIRKRMVATKLGGKSLQNMSIAEANRVALLDTANNK